MPVASPSVDAADFFTDQVAIIITPAPGEDPPPAKRRRPRSAAAAAAAPEERRVVPGSRAAKTRGEFIEFFGGTAEWERAQPE